MRLNLLITKWTSKLEEGALSLRARLSERMHAPPKRRLQLRQLEERVMMSATPIPVEVPDGGGDAATDPGVIGEDTAATATATKIGNEFVTVWSEEIDTAAETSSRELVFIDTGAEDYEQLVADLINNADSSRDFDVILLDSEQDGIAQITEVLAKYSDVDAIHIVSHGDDGEVSLGNVTLDANNLAGYSGAIASWGGSLSVDADLLIYGCNTAGSVEGKTLIQSLSSLTGADVAASTDDTGHAIFGGNWELEYASGQIETDVAFSIDVQQNWGHLLNVTVDATNTGTVISGALSATVSHTASGTDRLMLVGISFGQDKGATVTEVTYNGDKLTRVGFEENGDTRVEVWSLVAPDTGGPFDVDVTVAGKKHKGATIGVMTFNGVDQADALGVFGSAQGPSGNPSATVTSGAGEMVFGVAAVLGTADEDFVPDAGIERWDLLENKANGAGVTIAGASPNVVTSWKVSGAAQWAVGGVSIKSAGGANTPPTASSSTVNTDEDITYTFTAGDFNFSDADGDTLAKVQITSLETVGDLLFQGSAVTLNQEISKTEIDNGDLTFIPIGDESGASYDGFDFKVHDGTEYSTSSYVMKIDVDAVNDAPTAKIIGSAYGVTEDDGYRSFGGISVSDPDAGTNDVAVTLTVSNGLINLTSTTGLTFTSGTNNSASMTFTGTITDLNNALGTFTYRPDANFAGTDSLTLLVDDLGNTGGGALSHSDSANIVVSPVNDMPVLTAGSVVNLTVNEDSGFTSLGLSGIAYGPGGGADEASQTLTYQVTVIPAPSFGDVFLANGTTKVTTGSYSLLQLQGMQFKPADDVSGGPSFFSWHVIDDGGGSDTLGQAIQLNISGVNDSPMVGNGSLASVPEDSLNPTGETVDNLFSGSFNDVDSGSSMSGILIVTNPVIGTEGDWQYSSDSGISWYDIGTITSPQSLALDVSTRVRFVPAADYNGSPTGLSIRSLDNTYGGGFTSGATRVTHDSSSPGGGSSISSNLVSLDTSVSAVNDEPSFTTLGDQSVDEDSGPHSVVGFATALPGGGTDEAGQTFTYSVSNNNAGLFAVGPAIDASGNLTYTLAANANGTATVTVSVTDSGGTVNGGDDTSPDQTFDIIVNAIADEVTITANDAVAAEPSNNGQFTVTLSQASLTDTTIAYLIGGDAGNGSDYTALAGSVTILANTTTATIDVSTIDDNLLEDDETITVTLNSITAGEPAISIGAADNATVTLSDDDTAVVTIVATDATASEPSDNGRFTVSLSKQSDTDTVISYTVTGDAAAGSDYAALTGTVTILANTSIATIDVSVLDEGVVEANETVTVTLSSVTSGDADIAVGAANSDTVTIADDDTATVSIAPTSNGHETGPVSGMFTVTQSAAASVDTVLTYTVGGSATSGLDFTALSGTVTIAAGSTSATIIVPAIDDALVEATEDVIVTLTAITASDPQVTIDTANDDATLNIVDNDVATVSIANTTDGNEAGPVDGVFTVTQSAASSVDTVLTYSVGGSASSGSDFTALSGTVTIAAGSTSATIIVPTINDALVEATEDVIVTLTGITASDPQVTIDTASDDATLNIIDNDAATVSIANTTDGNESGPINGVFTVTQTLASSVDTVLTYSVGGSASSGSDFTALSGTVTIAAGSTSGTIIVPTLNDALVEATEDVIVTLTGITASDPQVTIDTANDDATLNIIDNDVATVSIANTTDGNESGPINGVFTVTQTLASSVDTVLTYSVGGSASSGSDFTALSGTVTIAAGSTSATINVATLNDALVEATEDVIVTLTGITASDPQVTIDTANDDATLNIIDNDVATVSIANTTDGNEAGPVNGVFTVTQTLASSVDTVLTYSVGGSASSGSDFTALSGTVTIAAGSTSATINVATLNDALVEATEDVIVTLTGITASDPQVTIDTANDDATLNVIDNDVATVSIANTTDGNESGPINGVFTLTQTLASSVDTVLTYSVGGSASSGSDFTALSGTVTIVAGSTSATIIVPTINDALVEASEDVIVTLTGITASDPQVTIDTANDDATLNIIDNDVATVSIANTTDGNEAGPVDGVFTVTQSAASSVDTVLAYSVGGSASSGSDFTALSGTITIVAGSTSATINVATLNDALVEATEDVIVTLTGITASDPQVTIDTANDDATLNIIDNDAATVSIANTTDGNEAGPVDGVFTVTQSAASSVDTVLTYSVGGSATAGLDYTALSGTVTIAAGSTSATIIVPMLDDALVEATEDVIVTLTGITADPQVTINTANDDATLTIADNDNGLVSIAATSNGDEDGPVDGVFTVTQTLASSIDTVLTYTVGGSATSGSDFAALTGSVTIVAGSTTASINVSTIDDALFEPTEDVVVTLTGVTVGDPQVTIDTANDDATLTISDNDSPVVSIAATTNGNEAGPVSGVFTVTQSAVAGVDTVLSYSIGGSATSGLDFTALSGTVTIVAGSTSATIDVATIDDSLVEATEDLMVTLTGITSGDPLVTIDPAGDDATLTIADNDSATVSIAATSDGNETGPVSGVFTVTQTAVASVDTVLTYSVGGSATSGFDFAALTGTVTIVAGSTSATINVAVIDDALVEATEDVIVTLTGITADPQVTIDSANDDATLNVIDNDSATVSIAATTNGNETGPVSGVFTVTQTATSSVDTVLTYTVGGSATSGLDFTALTGTVTIVAGSTSATINIATIDDALVEATETVAVTLTGIIADPQVTIDTANDDATLTITDNDNATVAIAATTNGSETGPVSGVFTVTQSAAASVDTVLTYSVSGSAASGLDFTSLSGTVTIAAGSTSATINVAALDDALVEATETVIVTLTAITADPQVTIDSANDDATITILDNDAATVSITNTTHGNEAGPANGVFTVAQSAASSVDTVLTYSVSGSAASGLDFTALSGTVTIVAGSTSASIDVAVLDDALVEATEDVIVTLTGITADPQVTIDSANDDATITILDNDAASVSIAATASGNESGPANGVFTVTQTSAASVDTILTYSVGGSATSGSDFTALSGTVTIVAGSTSATIVVPTINDVLVEASEDVIVTLTGITADPQVTIDTANDDANLTILDDDAATVSIANTTDGNEAGPVNGVLTVTQSAAASVDTVLTYTVGGSATSGSDFTALSGTVTIAAGSTSAIINVAALDDALVEATETVIVTLTGITADPQVTIDSANDDATLNILDDDTATVSIVNTNNGNEAGPVNGVFTVTQSAASSVDTVLTYSVSGSAASGLDFTALSGTVTIVAGSTSASIDVAVLDDALVEATEDVIVTLSGITAGDPQVTIDTANDDATLSIIDNDVATISIANSANSSESGPVDGVFTVTQSAAASVDTVLTYSVGGSAMSGTDFTALSGTVTIVAGSTSATINVATIDDALVEANEDVIVTLSGISGDPQVTIDTASDDATITILDNDAATVSIATTTNGNETGPVSGVFTFTQTAAASVDTVLTYTIGGSATSGSDFTALSGTVTIVAGSTSATINVATIDDTLVEATEDVIVTLTAITAGDPQVAIDTANDDATLTITDNDSAAVSIATTTNGNETGPVSGVFTVTQTAAASVDTVVSYSVSGSATSGVDFTALTGTVTIVAGSTSATINVAAIDDTLVEANEDVIVTLTGITASDPQITIDSAGDRATLTIADDDNAAVSIVATANGDENGPVGGVFTVTQSAVASVDTVVSYSVAGSATSGSDFTALSGTVTIVAGSTSATINVATIDDSLVESTEDVIVSLTGISGDPQVTIDSANDDASLTIADNDNASVSITATTHGDENGPVSGVFTVAQSAAASVDTVLAFSVSGSATSGTDFTALSGTVTIVAGSTTATINVATIDDSVLEATETVTVTLTAITSGDVDVSLGAAVSDTITIADDDTAEISITAGDPTAREGTPLDHGQFTVTLSQAADTITTVLYAVTGSATAGDDYVTLPGSITLAAGATTATIDVTLFDDYLLEGDETVIVTLGTITTGDSDIAISSSSAATVTITDNEVNPPSLTVPATIRVDEGLASGVFTIAASTVKTDGSELLQVLVDGIVEGATLSDGSNSFIGTATVNSVDVSIWDLSNLTITSSVDNDAEFTLNVAAIASSSNPTDDTPAVTTSANINIVVDAVADVPSLTVTSAAVGGEDEAIALTIAADLSDTDGSETLQIQILGVPAGASLSAGTDLGGGTWLLTHTELTGLTITPAANDDAEFALTITAIATESSPTTTDPTVSIMTAQTSATINVQVDAIADTPPLAVTSTATGDEDSPIALEITGSLIDNDGSESLTFEISGVPSGASLSAGVDLGGGTWRLTSADLTGLTITSPAGSDAEFQLSVTAIATESSPTTTDTTVRTATASSADTIDVRVDAVADAPSVSAPANVIAGEGVSSAPFGIGVAFFDFDGSESHRISISGIQNGATLSDGVNSFTASPGNNTVDVSLWTLAAMTITPSEAPPVDFTMVVTATATESAPTSADISVSVPVASTSRSIVVNVYNVNDVPIPEEDAYVTLPNTPLVVDIDGVLDNDFDEEGDALIATLVTLPTHGTVTLNADGTFTYVPDTNYLGPDSFEYTASDGFDVSPSMKVEIIVGGVLEEEDPTDPPDDNPKFKDLTLDTPIDAESDVVEPAAPVIAGFGVRDDATSRSLEIGQATMEQAEAIDAQVSRDRYEFANATTYVSRDVEYVRHEVEAVPLENLTHVSNQGVLWNSLNQMVERGGAASLTGKLIIGGAALFVAAVTYAYVIWTVWGGYLITSALSMMPGWRFIDPLPVLDQGGADDLGDDQESLATLLADNDEE